MLTLELDGKFVERCRNANQRVKDLNKGDDIYTHEYRQAVEEQKKLALYIINRLGTNETIDDTYAEHKASLY